MRYSKISSYNFCPRAYKFRYIDNLNTICRQDPRNPLIVGSSIHVGIEGDDAAKYYLSNYYFLKNKNYEEVIKLEYFLPKIKELISHFDEYRQEVSFINGDVTGIVDFLKKNNDGSWDIIDFKYSNNLDLSSDQLIYYKYYLTRLGYKIRKLYYIFIPKTWIYQKNKEDINSYRARLLAKLDTLKITVKEVKYCEKRAVELANFSIPEIYPRKEDTKNCKRWCSFYEYCIEGDEYMLIPENKRKETAVIDRPHFWIYGDSYTGKSTFIDSFKDVLFLNTDGNTAHLKSPSIPIYGKKVKKGLMTADLSAWEVFKETIELLKTTEHTYKIICIDLIEHVAGFCADYINKLNKVTHEADVGFGKGYQMIEREFNKTISQLKSMCIDKDLQLVFISKTKMQQVKNAKGQELTTISPEIRDKTANFLAGIVDMTISIFIDPDNKRKLRLKPHPDFLHIGSRINFKENVIKLDKGEFLNAVKNAQN